MGFDIVDEGHRVGDALASRLATTIRLTSRAPYTWPHWQRLIIFDPLRDPAVGCSRLRLPAPFIGMAPRGAR